MKRNPPATCLIDITCNIIGIFLIIFSSSYYFDHIILILNITAIFATVSYILITLHSIRKSIRRADKTSIFTKLKTTTIKAFKQTDFFSIIHKRMIQAFGVSNFRGTWQLFRFLLNKKTKKYYDNCIDELTIDLIEAKKFRKKYKRIWCGLCLWLRTFGVFFECLRIQGWGWALNLLLPPALRNWISRLGK